MSHSLRNDRVTAGKQLPPISFMNILLPSLALREAIFVKVTYAMTRGVRIGTRAVTVAQQKHQYLPVEQYGVAGSGLLPSLHTYFLLILQSIRQTGGSPEVHALGVS